MIDPTLLVTSKETDSSGNSFNIADDPFIFASEENLIVSEDDFVFSDTSQEDFGSDISIPTNFGQKEEITYPNINLVPSTDNHQHNYSVDDLPLTPEEFAKELQFAIAGDYKPTVSKKLKSYVHYICYSKSKDQRLISLKGATKRDCVRNLKMYHKAFAPIGRILIKYIKKYKESGDLNFETDRRNVIDWGKLHLNAYVLNFNFVKVQNLMF